MFQFLKESLNFQAKLISKELGHSVMLGSLRLKAFGFHSGSLFKGHC